MSKVYVVQDRPHYNLMAASRYGELITIFPEHDQLYDMDGAARTLLRKMSNFTEEDYVLPVGHPVAIATVASAAARMNGGRYKLLVWHPDDRVYYMSQVDLKDVPDREIQL